MARPLFAALILTLTTTPAAAVPPAKPGSGARPAPTRAPAVKKGAVVSVVMVGDVGFNKSQVEVHPDGVLEGGRTAPWAEMTGGIAPLIDGDLNFMNLETVLTDRNDLAVTNKNQKGPYFFRSHPNSMEHLVKLGFNLVSAANNHSYDYGEGGILETQRHLQGMADRKLLTFAGIGKNTEEAATPRLVSARGVSIAFSAIGAITNMLAFHRAGPAKPGSLDYRFEDDWALVTGKLGKTTAQARILSIHYGKERETRTDDKQRRDWRQAASANQIDVVVAHHAHVVRGVERIGESIIFYGLGNFLIRGARDMRGQKELHGSRDYGLLAKVYFAPADPGAEQDPYRYRVRAVEVVPIVDMHRAPTRWPAAEAKQRIEVLNQLSAELDDKQSGARGLRFQIRDDGTGLYCVEGAQAIAGLEALCKGYREPNVTRAAAKVAPASAKGGKRKGKR